MARDLDATLLETIRVRRRRLREAFLHGALRTRRVTADTVRPLVVSVVLAAVACAVCAGISFVRVHIGDSSSAGAPLVRVLVPVPAPSAISRGAA